LGWIAQATSTICIRQASKQNTSIFRPRVRAISVVAIVRSSVVMWVRLVSS